MLTTQDNNPWPSRIQSEPIIDLAHVEQDSPRFTHAIHFLAKRDCEKVQYIASPTPSFAYKQKLKKQQTQNNFNPYIIPNTIEYCFIDNLARSKLPLHPPTILQDLNYIHSQPPSYPPPIQLQQEYVMDFTDDLPPQETYVRTKGQPPPNIPPSSSTAPSAKDPYDFPIPYLHSPNSLPTQRDPFQDSRKPTATVRRTLSTLSLSLDHPRSQPIRFNHLPRYLTSSFQPPQHSTTKNCRPLLLKRQR